MPQSRRAYNRLPSYLQTDQNNRETYITDDVMFEPERAGFVSGYIGNTDKLTATDMERHPKIYETSAERQKYQLSLGAVMVDPDTELRSGGAFYDDIVGQLAANGGIVDNPNRLFETPFYTWTPPIDYDKHINFSRYHWVGAGNAEVNGEYIAKEPQGSQTKLWEVVNGALIVHDVLISQSAPIAPSGGQLWENSSDTNRKISKWDGSNWSIVTYYPVDDVPVSLTNYSNGDYLYIARTGPAYNRPLVWKYSTAAGRWVSQSVVVGPTPDVPSEGMVWENSSVSPDRPLLVYQNGGFVPLLWSSMNGPSGTPSVVTIGYDARSIADIPDGWSTGNWWRHYDDLSPVDRSSLLVGDQAIRPIVEFWAGIKGVSGDTKIARNGFPKFDTYGYNLTSSLIEPIGTTGTTVFQYQVGSGSDDKVLGFPVVFNASGEIQFEVTLETDTIAGVTGYRYFKDVFTGLTHGIWQKAKGLTSQQIDSNGLAEVPINITANADHATLTVASRSRILPHMSGVINSQMTSAGNPVGLNNYRWSDKDQSVGGTIIDCEKSLLRILATLQRDDLDIPTVIRSMARDYTRVMFKFTNRMNQLWDDLVISSPSDTLLVTPVEAVDIILTELFVGRNEDFPYYYSDMGNYVETQISGGVAVNISTTPKPIFIPPSPSRIGASPVYKPETFIDPDGITKLRGHDGSTLAAYGDDRDSIWLELHTRIYNKVPDYYKVETSGFSASHTGSNFQLSKLYGNSTPPTAATVADVVVDHTVITPPAGTVLLDTSRAVLAYYDGTNYKTSPILVDDRFKNTTDGEYYFYNGFSVVKVNRFERPYSFDYTTENFNHIMRREFERWAVTQNADFLTNSSYDVNDPFTWNYRSAGIEGHYMGIYHRVYRTIRPHSHPWEIVGYAAQPDWWTTQYPPTSVSGDGTPRYSNTHTMWSDLQAGKYAVGKQSGQYRMMAPIPVDAVGNLLDPIGAGIVNEDHLVPNRRDDSWSYADGASVEQQFRDSTDYPFAVALAGYLMKPAQFVDTVWSELYIDIGEQPTDALYNAPHVVHRDTLTRPSLSALTVHLEPVGGVTTQRVGLNAWISEYTRSLGNDVSTNFGKTMRGTEVSLGWKCAGYVNSKRTDIRTLSGIKIPFEDVHTLLHRSRPTKEFFGSGVLVARDGTGYRVFGFDLFDPYFEIDKPVVPIAGGQVELKEPITATADQHSFVVTQFKIPHNVQSNDTASVSILINGLKINPQHITITSSTTFDLESIVAVNAGDIITPVVLTTQSSPSTRVKQFRVNGVSFPYVDAGQGVVQRIEYGRYYETSTDVINFMLAYGRHLTSQGWVFDTLVSAGSVRDWLYGAKIFATWVLENTKNPNQGDFYFSPFETKAKFTSQFGQVLNVEALQNGAYGIVDSGANPIDPESVFTSRIDNELTMTTDGSVGVYGVRLLVVTDQHVVFLSNVTKFNDLMYDPLVALFHDTLRVDTYRSLNWDGRLVADGFVINNGGVLPNFEKQAKDFTRYYDTSNPVDDPLHRDQARELYGWYPNDEWVAPDGHKVPMMGAIGADERSGFNYHRGMLNSKGTIRPLIAFSQGTRTGTDNIFITEDWAWRWCEYGDTRHSIVQFKVNKHDFLNKRQIIEFNAVDNPNDDVLQIPVFDRNSPNDPRWVIPPISTDSGNNQYPYLLPITNGALGPNLGILSIKMIDLDTGFVVSRAFINDPTSGDQFINPIATATIDHATPSDPARYTDGVGAGYSDGNRWGAEQVGQRWWDQTRNNPMDGRAHLPDYHAVATSWGQQAYYPSTVVRVNDLVTVTTMDTNGLPVPHGLTTGDVVEISGANQPEYNSEVAVTVTSGSEFTYTISSTPTTPATGGVIVKTGFIDVFEWVRSLLTPTKLLNCNIPTTIGGVTPTGVNPSTNGPTPDGVPINGVDTSYVTVMEPNANGVNVPVYYYWVKNKSTPPAKTVDNPTPLTVIELANMMEAPANSNTPWAAIVDDNHLILYAGNVVIEDNYAIEIEYDQRVLDNHAEWLLVAEGDKFNPLPTPIGDKITDSLAGVDAYGSVVPSPLLAITEKYGTDTFPPQTLFSDRLSALQVFVDAVNQLTAAQSLNTILDLTTVFPLSDEGNYWKRASYLDVAYVGVTVTDTVANNTVRDNRLAAKHYVNGDLVKVLQSSNIDLWSGGVTATTYALVNGTFMEVGVDNATLALTLNATHDGSTIRNVITKVYSVLSKADQNTVAFAVLYEMLRQHPNADWFIKTSYMDLQVFDTVTKSPFVRPNETDAIVANALDTKPYRTKLRSQIYTHSIDSVDAANVQIIDTVDQKVTILLDRLACSVDDDGGWDTEPWDELEDRWDFPFWDWANQGLDEWISLGVQTGGTANTRYTFISRFDPTRYSHRIIMRDNGTPVNMTDIGHVVRFIKLHTSVIAEFNAPLGSNITIELEQTRAFYIGGVPTLGDTLANSSFTVTPSSFKHHVVRQMEMGLYAPFASMDECYTTPATNPQERVSDDIIDSVSIKVSTEWTPSYAGWDTTPWDATAWDMPPINDGPRSFYILAGNEPVIPAGPAVFMTSEPVVVSNTHYVTRQNSLPISRVDLNGTQLVEGVDYVQSSVTPRVVEFLTHPDSVYHADGATTTFSLANPSVNKVMLNNVLMTSGVHYTISGNTLTWLQFPPTVSSLKFTPLGVYYMGDNATVSFNSNHPTNSVSANNAFVWKNATLQIPSTDYTANATNSNIDFVAPPFNTDGISIFSLGNGFGNSSSLFNAYNLVGDGVTTSYPVGDNANNVTAFVFVNGIYQVLGADYTIPVQGTIQFTTPPPNGDLIHVRVLPPTSYTAYNIDHVQFNASGGPVDTIVGIADASPDNMMLFRGGNIQNGYSATQVDYTITAGNPNTINWSVPPTAGTPISVRIIRSVTVGQTTIIHVSPSAGGVVTVSYNPILTAGDTVDFYHNQFPIGSLHNVNVSSVPTTYDIINGVLIMDNPVLNGFINVNYLGTRFGPNPTDLLVCMPHIVDRALADHLLYDGVLGYESNRRIGVRVLDTTNSLIYSWDGTGWVDTGVVLAALDQIMVLEDSQILEYSGTIFNVVYSVGTSFTNPPLLQYPNSGIGVVSGGYALGQLPNAATDFPDAYQIWQHLCG